MGIKGFDPKELIKAASAFPGSTPRDRQRSGDSPFPTIPDLKPKKRAVWMWPLKKGTVGAKLEGAWGHEGGH